MFPHTQNINISMFAEYTFCRHPRCCTNCKGPKTACSQVMKTLLSQFTPFASAVQLCVLARCGAMGRRSASLCTVSCPVAALRKRCSRGSCPKKGFSPLSTRMVRNGHLHAPLAWVTASCHGLQEHSTRRGTGQG